VGITVNPSKRTLKSVVPIELPAKVMDIPPAVGPLEGDIEASTGAE
jgi:hypothetical protein